MQKLFCFLLLSGLFTGVWAGGHRTRVPFIYVIDYTRGQERASDFRANFDCGVPALYHPGPDLRYLGRFGFGSMVIEGRETPYEVYEKELRDYLHFLRKKGVRWVTPYLCNQTISGNDHERFGAWEVYDSWNDFTFLNLGPKPPDPIEWMQREPSGNLHYNYKRKCFFERHGDDVQLRFAPCPNNEHWRRLMNAEARNAARIGFDGLFIDNNIIHCYCESCQDRFQHYLKQKYNPTELKKAFGTLDYAEITLYPDGDFRHWARSFEKFNPWLEHKYPDPQDRRIYFDTTGGLGEINVDAAGGGMLFGEAEAFLKEQVLPYGERPAYENIRLANPALAAPEGRLRWAETMMFWAHSIGDQLAELARAGCEINENFFLIPNWGVRQRIAGAAGRAEDGKDMRRWRTGAEWQMYEEDSATGIIAPGVVLDYDMQLRYAYACGVRAMLLPYTLDHADVVDVHHAETAISGSSVFVTVFKYPEVRAKYRAFFESHPDLFEGYQSGAEVALAHFFDQTHYLNLEHLREVHALNRFLADQQIPFDHIIEDDFSAGRLADYRVIILPQIEFMSDEEVAAIRDFLDRGGAVISIGRNATYDRYCRPRTASLRNQAAAQLIQFESLEAALPYRGIYLEEGLQAARSPLFSLDFDSHTDKYRVMRLLDEKFGFKRYLSDGPLTEVLREALGRDPHLLDPHQASGVRHTLWVGNSGKRFVIYLANKNVALAGDDHSLKPVHGLEVTLPFARKAVRVQYYRPGLKTVKLKPRYGEPGGLSCVVPMLNAFGVVELTWE